MMMTFPRAIAALALCTAPLAPLSVQAGEVMSAELELGISRNVDTPTFFKRVEGSFATQFDGRFNAQVDLGMSKYEAVGSTSPFLALHLTYALSDQWNLGVYLSGEDRLGTSYTMTGVEIAYSGDGFRADAYLAHQKPTLTGLSGDLAGVDLEFDLGRNGAWTALAGGHFGDFGSSTSDSIYLGLARRIGDDVTLETRVAQHDGSDMVVSVSAQIALGQGVTFNRRDWFANFPAH